MEFKRGADFYSLWWQVAFGVFIGLTAHSILTGLYIRYEAQQALQQINAQVRAATRDAQRPARATRPLRPLSSDERCVDGHRLQRIDNGWRDLPNDPC